MAQRDSNGGLGKNDLLALLLVAFVFVLVVGVIAGLFLFNGQSELDGKFSRLQGQLTAEKAKGKAANQRIEGLEFLVVRQDVRMRQQDARIRQLEKLLRDAGIAIPPDPSSSASTAPDTGNANDNGNGNDPPNKPKPKPPGDRCTGTVEELQEELTGECSLTGFESMVLVLGRYA